MGTNRTYCVSLVRPRRALLYVSLIATGCQSSTDRLIAQLQDGDPQVRRAAARALGETPANAGAAAALGGALADSDTEVRELAAASLGQIGPAVNSSVPALEQALTDPEPSVRLTAALAIQKIEPKSRSFAPVLVAALRAGDGTVFVDVGRMGDEASWAVPTLTALLSDPRTKIRALAAHALGEIGVPARDAKTALQQRLRDPEASVRKAAQTALQQIAVREANSGV